MKMSGNTILITGGATGIGLAFAERFLKHGNTVIVVGRRESKLTEVKRKFPELITRVCDVSKEEDRIALFKWVTSEYPDTNILVNNAGIQQRLNLQEDTLDWTNYANEIEINLHGPIHLTMLFVSHFLQKTEAAILNVSSGLAFTPGVWVPVYSATKAGIHSFTQSLRLQLEKTNIKVIEIFPPAVNTDLGGEGLHTFGAPVEDFANEIFKELENGAEEIGYGGSKNRLRASRDELDEETKKAWYNFKRNNPNF
ncbi:SDR family oxidoreductase [Robertmurraya sp. Marseille-Q9965]